MQRLAALVARPRLHLIRFHGVLAPHAKRRAAIVPDAVRPMSEPAHEHGQAARVSRAGLLSRVFDIYVERCACGGQLKILAAIEDPVVIVRIATHRGLPARAPPRAPARAVPRMGHAAHHPDGHCGRRTPSMHPPEFSCLHDEVATLGPGVAKGNPGGRVRSPYRVGYVASAPQPTLRRW